jgi:hypothetical protein
MGFDPNDFCLVHQTSFPPMAGVLSRRGRALLEMKIVMVLTLREFNVKSAFIKQQCGTPDSLRTMNGDPAYQVQGIAAKPKDGSPSKVIKHVLFVRK